MFFSEAFYNLKKNIVSAKTKARRIFYTALLKYLTCDWDLYDELNCKYIHVKNEVLTLVSRINQICKDAGLLELAELFDNLAWTEEEIRDELIKLVNLY